MEPIQEQRAGTPPAGSRSNIYFPAGYDNVRPLGQGGFGTVYLARDVRSGTYRAVKMIITDDDRKAIRAQKEIDVLKPLDHPNICRFIDCAVDGRIFYIILEYCLRGDLNRYLRDQTRTPREVPAKRVLVWFRQLASATAVSFSHMKACVPAYARVANTCPDCAIVWVCTHL